MRILILGHYEIHSNYAISLLVDALYSQLGSCQIQIMLSGQGDKRLVINKSTKSETQNFSGLAEYETRLCDELNSGINSLGLNCNSFNQLTTKTKHEILLLDKPNSKQGLNQIKASQPDLIISIRYRKILHALAISIPSKGIINLHSGLLPEYRGVMATFWSMLVGEKNIGSTLHYISDKTIDTGAIIERSSRECNYQNTYFENVLSLYKQGVEDTIRAVDFISGNQHLAVQTSESNGNYYTFPKSSDLEVFLKNGQKLY